MHSETITESSSDESEQDILLRRVGVMEARAEHMKTRNYRSIYVFTSAVGVGLVVMVLSWCIRHRGGFSWTEPQIQFNWHPLLMVIGMVFLYGHSILIFRTYRNIPKKWVKISHATIHGTVFIFAVIALKAVFDSHNYAKPPIPNLYTLHSWMGLTAVILFAAQFLVGFTTFLYPGLSRTLRAILLPVHSATGVSLFILVLMTVVTGLTEKALWAIGKNYQNFSGEGILVNFIAVFTALFGILVLHLVNNSDYKRPANTDDEVALSRTES